MKGKIQDRVFNLATRQITPEDKREPSEGILNWGSNDKNNDFPQYCLKIIDRSPTLSALLNTKKQFIAGDGVNTEISKLKVNGHQTLDELVEDIASDLSYLYGYALKVTWRIKGMDGTLVANSIELLPLEAIRLGYNEETYRVDSIKYNPYFGDPKNYKEDQTESYKLWKDDINQIKKDIQSGRYLGHVLYYNTPRPGHRFYPYPNYAAALDWAGSEGEIGAFHYDNIASGFMLRAIYTVIGKPDQAVEWEEYTLEDGTTGTRPSKTLEESATEALQKMFSGAKGSKIMMNFAESENAVPKIQAFTQDANDDLYTNVQNLITEVLARAEGIPSILANINAVGAFNVSGDLFINAMEIMHSRVSGIQRQIEKDLKRILRYCDTPFDTQNWIIKNFYPKSKESEFEKAWEVMTIQERRNWIKENTSFELLETIQQPPTP